MTGAAFRVTAKLRVVRFFVGWPSLTVTVRVATPFVLGTGRKVSAPVSCALA